MTNKEDRRNIKRIIKTIEDRDVLLRNAGMLFIDQKNVKSSKSKSKRKKWK
jgi:hypothetical protein